MNTTILSQRRLEARRHFVAHAFAIGDQRDTEVLLTDISYRGCQLRGVKDFSKGERVSLLVHRRGTAVAEIRWALGDRAGARFLY